MESCRRAKKSDHIDLIASGQSTGIKPDLGPHYSTGLFPFFMDMQDLLWMAKCEELTRAQSHSCEFPYAHSPMKECFTPKPPKEKICRPAEYEHRAP